MSLPRLMVCEGTGDDRAEQLKGRKRHQLVDAQALVLAVKVHPADVMGREGVALLSPPEQIIAAFPRLTHDLRAEWQCQIAA